MNSTKQNEEYKTKWNNMNTIIGWKRVKIALPIEVNVNTEFWGWDDEVKHEFSLKVDTVFT